MRYVNEPTPGSLADEQPDADPEQVARTILLRRLSAAPRTRKECRDDLIKRGVPEEAADRVLDRFVEVGLIDDSAYAQLWAQSRHRTRGSSRSVLRQELRAKGIADDVVVEALEPIDDDAEASRARLLVAKKLPTMSRFDDATRERRLIAMLVRRGYPGHVARSAVRDAIGESSSEDFGLE